jgi:hypothetical protein
MIHLLSGVKLLTLCRRCVALLTAVVFCLGEINAQAPQTSPATASGTPSSATAAPQASASNPNQTSESSAQQSVRLPSEQLDSLVAPVALYPDPLLSQTLVASTYPLEVVQLQQWSAKHKELKDKALADAVQKEDWDPSVQALAALPEVVKQLADNIKWTTDLGNAFLAQQTDVMDAVQRMRQKAKDNGNLKNSEQQKVETKVVEKKQVIVIEQASPDVIYVPSYNPTVVYGAAVYPYPPIYYPPAGYYAAGMALSFGVGVAMGAAWGGGWGWGCGWGGNNVYINNNNNFVRNSNNYANRRNTNVSNRSAANRNTWQHNPRHRGGAPYGDRATARQYGGTPRGASAASRQGQARQYNARQGQQGGIEQAANRSSAGGARSSGGSTGGNGSAGARSGTMSSNRGGGGDKVGNRSVSGSGGSRTSAFSGGGGSSGQSARSSSARGASSIRGGGRRGGGRR